MWLRLYLDAFGSQRVFVVLFEELVARPLETLGEICRFLDVAPFQHLEPRRANKTELMRFQTLLRLYTGAGRVGGKLIRHVVPQPAQVKLIQHYHAGHRQLGRKLSTGEAPKIDDGTRAWCAEFYRDSIESVRALTGLSLAAWERDFQQTSTIPLNQPDSVAPVPGAIT
jgi:hypothetical protein